jgi:Fe-S cluster assembly iron-binding protein IscA
MLDKNTINYLKEKWVENIKIFFYDSGCSWTKLDLEENPDISDLVLLKNQDWVNIYSSPKDKDKFKNCTITRVVKADHTWKEKIRYIFSSEEVKDRCGCGSSFSFDKKELKIDFEKLKNLKNNLKKWI